MTDEKLSERINKFLDNNDIEDAPIYEWAKAVEVLEIKYDILERQSLELYDAAVKTEEARIELEGKVSGLEAENKALDETVANLVSVNGETLANITRLEVKVKRLTEENIYLKELINGLDYCAEEDEANRNLAFRLRSDDGGD